MKSAENSMSSEKGDGHKLGEETRVGLTVYIADDALAAATTDGG